MTRRAPGQNKPHRDSTGSGFAISGRRPIEPRAGLSLSADIHLNVLNNSYDRMQL